MSLSVSFLGGVGTVTGSKYLLEHDGGRVLVDCGLFQGFKNLRQRNRAPLPVGPRDIDAVILTHAHLDHSGYLPLLVKHGFSGPVYCSRGTRDLCRILLPDSGHLQEQDTEYANRHGFSRHKPALPLYTREDAVRSLDRLQPVPFDEGKALGRGIDFRLQPAGHILGAAMAELFVAGKTLVFSGDLGRPGDPIMPEPAVPRQADYLVVESTYGGRRHEHADPQRALAAVIARTVQRGGSVLVPAFAVGRTQMLLYYLWQLKKRGEIADVPVFLDSPMAINASELLHDHAADVRLTAAECRATCEVARYLRTSDESKSLNDNPVPSIIVSASGMATGGRVLHHLKRMAPDPRNTILFTGFQAGGTRGAKLLAGADTVKIHGEHVPVRAEVDELSMLSAHADADEILAWLGAIGRPPRMTFVTHGEPEAADALRLRIEEELGWPCLVPDYRDRLELD